MKNITLSLTMIFLLCVISGFSQTDSTDGNKEYRPLEERKNELKLGAVKLILGPILDLEYERIFSKYSSLGGNMVINLNPDNNYNTFSFSPYYRMYFSRQRDYGTSGFFAQGFMGYYTGKSDEIYMDGFNPVYDEDSWNAFGAGLSLGGKWVNKQGFSFQIIGGIGRMISGDDLVTDVVFQGDLFVGYRF